MTPERRAKLRRTAEWAIRADANGCPPDVQTRDLANGLIECLDALEVQPIKDPYRELQAFLDEVRPDKPAPSPKVERSKCTWCEGKGKIHYGDRNTGFSEDCDRCYVRRNAVPRCRDGVIGCTVQHPHGGNAHAFVAPVPPGPPLTEHGSVCSCWSCNERTV